MATSKKKKEERKLNVNDLRDTLSLSQRDKFVLNIKYKNQQHSLGDWRVILAKEGFGLKNTQL